MYKLDKRYLPGLDVLRFLLAVSILIVHFPHFLDPFSKLGIAQSAELPLNSFFWIIYSYGGFAVEIFWMVSGIIFYHFYMELIRDKLISFKQFIFLRFTRLYPLHFITLVLVAVLQFIYLRKFQVTFVYTNNDTLHFILNLLMINFWNAKFGLSFNGPFWSVSAEMFVYMIFFLLAFVQIFSKLRNTTFLVLVSFVFYSLGIFSPFYECLLYFFAGILMAQYLGKMKLKEIGFLFIVICIYLLIKFQFHLLPKNEYLIRALDCFCKLCISWFCVAAFAKGFSSIQGNMTKSLRQLGNMTYASYMVHFPIQLILVLTFYDRGLNFFNNIYFFFFFIVGTCLIGYFLFLFFEVPVQNILRKKFILKK